MGTIIERCKFSAVYKGRAHEADGFATDNTGRLIPQEGESFETMPLGCLDLVSFVNIGSSYRRNPETTEGMKWEIGFSEKRISFFSPDNSKQSSRSSKKTSHATLGFYFYHELRSLSLASAESKGGPYVSMVFVIKVNRFSQIPMGVRVHGTPEVLHIFATALVARLMEHYDQICSCLGVDARELKTLFGEVEAFDFQSGIQTDLFISAMNDTVRVSKNNSWGQVS